jgi:hypothetical protein
LAHHRHPYKSLSATISSIIRALRKQLVTVCPIWHKRCTRAVRERDKTETEEKFFEEGESNQAARAISKVLTTLLAHLMRGCGSPGEFGAQLLMRL